ncbi:MAG: hypothetical protein ACI9JZ_000535, partial [Lentimonas sp.]
SHLPSSGIRVIEVPTDRKVDVAMLRDFVASV